MHRLVALFLVVAVVSLVAGALPVQAQNLLQNPDAEEDLVGGQIPGWTTVSGNWTYRGSNPQEFEGDSYFFGGSGSGTSIGETTELRQDVDVSAFAASIDAGTQPFTFAGYIRALTDEARVLVEYQSSGGTVLASYDSGLFTEDTHWELLRDVRTAPPGTRTIRVRLLCTYLEPTNNSGYFDTFTLVADDGAPQSAFDASLEAWRLEGDPVEGSLMWVANGGNPGGFAQHTDANTGILIRWLAPPSFLGDQSSQYGGQLRFDRITSTRERSFTVPDDVRLLGADGTLFLTYDMPDGTEPDLTWTSGSVPLTETGWVNDGTGEPATQMEFQAVLADLERIEIVAEYTNEPETNGLDNVAFEGGAGCEQSLAATVDDDTPAPGQTITFAVTLTNTAAAPAALDLWLEAERNGNPVRRTRLGSGTLPPGATVSRDLRVRIPGGAPGGAYDVDLIIGEFATDTECDVVPFVLTVDGAAGREAAAVAFEVEAPVSLGGAAAVSAAAEVSAAFALHAAAPNPFTRQTTLRYDLPEASPVRLAVYDVLGREVVVLVDGAQEAGVHAAALDARGLPGGTYLVRLVVEERAFTRRVTLVR